MIVWPVSYHIQEPVIGDYHKRHCKDYQPEYGRLPEILLKGFPEAFNYITVLIPYYL